MPVKYSGANQCFVALYAIEEEIQLIVRDAGASFDVEEAKRNRGLGLVSMQGRVRLVHGKGTRIFTAVFFVAEFSGAVEAREWVMGMYKHLDHPLRQFGA
jgi:hypothetical protein